jgi:predicted DNA-binding antitoxin AbrB/MazE fold protein
MGQRVRVIYDGEVLRPEEPMALQAGTTYLVTVEQCVTHLAESASEDYPLGVIKRMAVDMGVTDMGEHHTDYARGTRALGREDA